MPNAAAIGFVLVLAVLLAGCLREHWGRNG